MRASSSSVPGSLNGIRPARTAVEPLGVLVDAEDAQAGVGEAQREREADAAETDDRDVVGHAARAGYCDRSTRHSRLTGTHRPLALRRMMTAVRTAVEAVGLQNAARWVHTRVAPTARRNRIDNEHQRLLMAFTLAADANCIDVGAHGGAVLREIVRCAPSGTHIAFEPLPAQASALRCAFPAVDVREIAVSDENGTASFVHVRSNPEMSGLRERDYPGPQQTERMTVRTCRLDDALPDGYVPALVKIDVEGAELRVLRGAIETLRRYRPSVIFEHGVGGPTTTTRMPRRQYTNSLARLGCGSSISTVTARMARKSSWRCSAVRYGTGWRTARPRSARPQSSSLHPFEEQVDGGELLRPSVPLAEYRLDTPPICLHVDLDNDPSGRVTIEVEARKDFRLKTLYIER